MPVPGSQRQYGYNPTMGRPPSMPPLHALEPPHGIVSAAGPAPHHPLPFGYMGQGAAEDQRYQPSLGGGAIPPAVEITQLPGPSQMAAYSLPPVGAMEGGAFHQPIPPPATGHQNLPAGWLQ